MALAYEWTREEPLVAVRSLARSEEKVGVEEKERERGRLSMGDMVCWWWW